MKKSFIFKAIALVIMVVSILTIASGLFESNAAVTGAVDPSSLTGKGGTNTTGIQNLGNQIISIISVIGSIVSVIVLIVLGLKYMMGSAEEKAEYKKTLMPYLIGAVLIFAASVIAGAVFGFASNIKLS